MASSAPSPHRESIHDLFRAMHQAEAAAATITAVKRPKRATKATTSSCSTSQRAGASTSKKRKAVTVPHINSDDSDIEILDLSPVASTSSITRTQKKGRPTVMTAADEGSTSSRVATTTLEASKVNADKGETKPVELAPIDLTIDETGTEDEDVDVESMKLPELDDSHSTPPIDGSGSNDDSQAPSWSQWDNDEGAHKGEQQLFLDNDHDDDDEVDEPLTPYEGEGGGAREGDEMWGEEAMDEDNAGDVVFVDEFDDQPIEVVGQQGSSKDLVVDDEEKVSPSSDASTCPVCSASLNSMTKQLRETHVNSCLDSGAAASSSRSGGLLSSLFGSRSKAPQSGSTSSAKGKGRAVATPEPGLNTRRPLSSLIPSFSFPSASSSSSGPNAFTALMTGHAETKQWKLAEEADKQKGRLPKGEVKKVPFYKWVEGLQITVDAFRYNAIEGCKAYFLTHAHSDHYQNLSANWSYGPIYCSVTTANLIKLKLGVKDEYLKPLPMNQTVKVHGIDVTLIDANHCPGSVLFLFEGPHTDPKSPYSKTPSRIFRYLHCGDFRASPQHILHPAVRNKRIDICYLDTTYLDAKYCFPAQELVIDACSQLVRERVLEGDEEALNRLAGEAEVGMRKGMKGWLMKGGVKKEEEGVKKEEEERAALKEEEDEDERVMMEMEGLEAEVKEESNQLKAEEEKKVETTEEEIEAKPKDDEAGEDRKPKLEDEEDEKKKPRIEKLLVMVGTYSIGKERIVKGIAKALNTKIYCDERKSAILTAQDDPELHALMTSDPLEGQVHMCWLNSVNRDAMSDYHAQYSAKRVEGGYTQVIGLRPTGWTYKGEGAKGEKVPTIAKILERERMRKFSPAGMYPQRDSTSTFLGYGVPYSEHSSFYELTCFALSLDYVRMIPTVNVHTPTSRKKMDDWMARWKAEKKRRADARIPRMVPPRSENYW